ncbi:hypothetical protein ACWGDE_05705 [Streptomyces sp. NPDC054956]
MPARRHTAKIARLALAAALVTGVAATATIVDQPAAYAAPTSSVGGKISRSEIIGRAEYWMNKGLPYDQDGSYTDSSGKTYRTDCSGYVSMAWHLAGSPNTIALNDYSYEINMSELKPGDILNSPAHVILFDKWEDAAKTRFSYYTFGSTPVAHRTVSVNDATWDSHAVSTYTPRRYTNVIDDVSVKDTVHLQRITPNGDLFNAEGDFAAGKWSPWANQSASQLKEVTSAGTGSVNRVFAIGSDNKIYEKDGDYAAGKWSGWFAPALDNSKTFTAVSASSYGNTVHLVAIGTDGHLYNTDGDFTAGKWNGWTDKGGTNLKHVTSATTADQVNHIFATDASGQILELDADYAGGSWNNWSVAGPAGGFKALDVTASASGNTVHLGAISLGGQYFNTDGDFAAGKWNGWSNMGGDNLKRVTSASANGVNHVFATTGTNRLIERDANYNTGSWNDWAEAAGGADATSATASFTN